MLDRKTPSDQRIYQSLKIVALQVSYINFRVPKTSHNNIKIGKMMSNYSNMNSLYLTSTFHSIPQYFIFIVPPTQNFTAFESLEVPKVLSLSSQETKHNQAETDFKLGKMHRFSKPVKANQKKLQHQICKSQSNQALKSNTTISQPTQKHIIGNQCDQMNLDFPIEWKNQYRNIVPNVINQILSFLTKKAKSEVYISKLFKVHPHAQNWQMGKFYQYMKRIKEEISHYVDQRVIRCFFQTHKANTGIYGEGQEQFYLKISRITVQHYLRRQAISVCLTSPRMKHSKRSLHLIARRVLLSKLEGLARDKNTR